MADGEEVDSTPAVDDVEPEGVSDDAEKAEGEKNVDGGDEGEEEESEAEEEEAGGDEGDVGGEEKSAPGLEEEAEDGEEEDGEEEDGEEEAGAGEGDSVQQDADEGGEAEDDGEDGAVEQKGDEGGEGQDGGEEDTEEQDADDPLDEGTDEVVVGEGEDEDEDDAEQKDEVGEVGEEGDEGDEEGTDEAAGNVENEEPEASAEVALPEEGSDVEEKEGGVEENEGVDDEEEDEEEEEEEGEEEEDDEGEAAAVAAVKRVRKKTRRGRRLRVQHEEEAAVDTDAIAPTSDAMADEAEFSDQGSDRPIEEEEEEGGEGDGPEEDEERRDSVPSSTEPVVLEPVPPPKRASRRPLPVAPQYNNDDDDDDDDDAVGRAAAFAKPLHISAKSVHITHANAFRHGAFASTVLGIKQNRVILVLGGGGGEGWLTRMHGTTRRMVRGTIRAAAHADAVVVDSGMLDGFLARLPKDAASEAVCIGCSKRATAESAAGLSRLHKAHVVLDGTSSARAFALAKADLVAAIAGPYKVVCLLVGTTDGVEEDVEVAAERGWPILALPGTMSVLKSDEKWASFPSGANGSELASFLHIHLTIDLFA